MDETKQVSNLRKWGGLAILSLALAIVIIDQTLINVSLRTIVKDLHTTVHSLQWVITGYALTLSAFTITGGRLGDLFGRKRIFVTGAVVFAIGAITATTAPNVTQLLIGASVIEGLGAAMMLPATTSLILANFRGHERAIAFGVWGGVAGASASIGPLVGGYLTTYYSWRYGYGINLGIIAILLLFSWVIQDSRENISKPKIDFVGVFLSVVGLAAVVYGVVQSSTDGWYRPKDPANLFGHTVNLGNHSEVPFVIAFGVAVLIMFVLWEAIVELRGKLPLVSLSMFANTPFVAGIVTMAIVAMGQFGAIFALPVFFQAARGLDAFHTGLAFLPFTLATFFAAPISGFLASKHIRPKYLIITGLIIDATGLYLVHNALTPSATAADLRLPLLVFGVGFGMAFAQLANLTLSAVSVQQAGEASGLNNTFRQLGATFGNAVIGSVLISALTANYAADIASSTKLPPQLKPRIQAGVETAVQSLGQESPTSSANGHPVPPAITSELSRITDDATARAVRHAFGFGVIIVAVGVVSALRLPLGGDHGADAEVAASSGSSMPKSSNDNSDDADATPIPTEPARPHRRPSNRPVAGPIRL
jgi:EmrB/QacA subfamily drug resistance transporter